MYRSHFFSNDIAKVMIYKKYSNKLNKIKSTSKVNYYNAQFEKCRLRGYVGYVRLRGNL